MLYTHAIAAALALAIGLTTGWKTATWRAEANAAQVHATQAREEAMRFERATSAARSYEVVREAARVRTVTAAREVAREVAGDAADAAGCAGVALPGGLRDALERAAAGAGESGAARAVPAPRAASAADLG